MKNGEKILVTLPDSIAAVEGIVGMVHPDGETVSASVLTTRGYEVIGVVFKEDGLPRQGFVKRGLKHATYRPEFQPSIWRKLAEMFFWKRLVRRMLP
jgi:hypothetical protein